MGLKSVFEEAIGLGRSEDVRKIAVGGGRARVDRPVQSTPGARVRIVRDGHDGESARVMLWCVRNDVPFELVTGAPGIWVDGTEVPRPTPALMRERLGR